MAEAKKESSLHHHPVEILQRLIQFDTTNPPGNESECIAFIDRLLTEVGIETTVLSKAPNRSNLVARLSGRGDAPPLLLYGHVDVVTTKGQDWQHPPFEGVLRNGYVWGRGALDMKGGVAMMLVAFLRAKTENLNLPGDVILAVVSDEEAAGEFGAKFLVEEHPDLFDGVRYAIGEFGGFTFHIGNTRFYPIQIAEKQFCWMKATVHGPGGHGSVPVRGGAVARLAELLRRLDTRRLPVHITPPARVMLRAMAASLSGASGLLPRLLMRPALADIILRLLGERGRIFDPLIHNSVSPTILQGSDKINVIPGRVSVELDGRLLPGFQPEDLITELRSIVGEEVDLDVVQYDPGPVETDMGLFETLADVLRQADPGGVPVPLLLSGVTDARFFSRLGIQSYGFTPMDLPEDFSFLDTIHAADERIPVDALAFGTDAIYELLGRFGD